MIKIFKRAALLLPLATVVGCHSTGHEAYDYSSNYATDAVSVATNADGIPLSPPYEDTVPAWPGSSDALVFSWADGAAVNIKKTGEARVNEAGIMDLAKGSIRPQGFDQKLLEACSHSNELSIEVVLMTDNTKQSGPARIVSFSKDTQSRNFTLGQQGDNLILRVRTTENGANGSNKEINLTKIGKDPMHLIVCYRPGKTACYVDGKEVLNVDVPKGDFSNWEPMSLILGDELTNDRNWNGSIERIAIGNKFINAKQAEEQFNMLVNDMED